ncbi:hypothetical protein M8494_03050 [Serratia ureilytica]
MLNDIEEIRFTATQRKNLRGMHPDPGARYSSGAALFAGAVFPSARGCAAWRASEMVRAGGA